MGAEVNLHAHKLFHVSKLTADSYKYINNYCYLCIRFAQSLSGYFTVILRFDKLNINIKLYKSWI